MLPRFRRPACQTHLAGQAVHAKGQPASRKVGGFAHAVGIKPVLDVGCGVINARCGVLCAKRNVGCTHATGGEFIHRPREADGGGLVDANGHGAGGTGVPDTIGRSQREGVDAFREGQVNRIAGGGGPRATVEGVVNAGHAGPLAVVRLRHQPADGNLSGLLPCPAVADGHRTDGRSGAIDADEEG